MIPIGACLLGSLSSGELFILNEVKDLLLPAHTVNFKPQPQELKLS